MKKILLLLILTYVQAFSQSTGLLQDTAVFNGKFNNRPFACADKNGRLHLCFTAQSGNIQQSRDIFYAVEDADSFRTFRITSNLVDDNYPTLSSDNFGRIHLAFEQKDNDGNFQVKYTNNVKGSFITPIFITSGGLNKATPYSAAGPDSLVHFIYFTYTSGRDSLYYRNYNYKSGQLSRETALAEAEASGDYEASIAADSKGIVHIVMKGGQDENGRLRYFRGIRGLIREAYTGVAGSVETPRILTAKGDAVYILYRQKDDQALYITDNTRGRFSPPLKITPQGHRPCMFSNFSSDDAGHVYVFYYSPSLQNGRGYYLVHGSSGSFSDTIGISYSPGEYIIRNTASCAAKGNGEIALFYSSSGIRSVKGIKKGEVESGIFLKRGTLIPRPYALFKDRALDFGTVPVNTTAGLPLSVANSGTAVLKLYSASVNNKAFGAGLTDTIYVDPGSTVSLNINFTPSDTLWYDGQLSLSTNAVNAEVFSFNLIGKGAGTASAIFDKDTLCLTPHGLYKDSLLITNSGSAPLSVDSLKLRSASALIYSPPGFSLQPGMSRYIYFGVREAGEEVKLPAADSLLIYTGGGSVKKVKKIMLKVEGPFSGIRSGMNQKNMQTEGRVKYRLDQNYPNPFNPQTMISFTIPHRAAVSLKVYDELAREIATLVDDVLEEGTHSFTFQAGDISTGVYYYKIFVQGDRKSIPDFIDVKKMLFMK